MAGEQVMQRMKMKIFNAGETLKMVGRESRWLLALEERILLPLPAGISST